MHMKNRPPTWAPSALCELTKGDLADLVWCLAQRCAESCDDHGEVYRIVLDEYESQRKADAAKPKLRLHLAAQAKAFAVEDAAVIAGCAPDCDCRRCARIAASNATTIPGGRS